MTAEDDRIAARLDALRSLDATASEPVAAGRREVALGTAFAARPAVEAEVRPGTPIAALVEVSDALDADLDTLDDAGWATPVVYGWDIRGTISHLTAVHEVLLDRLCGRRADPITELELDDATDARIAADALRPTADVRASWRSSVCGLRHAAALADLPVCWLGLETTSEMVLLDRAFETWIHAGDVRRATNRSSLDVSGQHLHLLCNLAVGLLPLALVVTRRSRDAMVTLNLSGPGGGTWAMPVGTGRESGVEVVLNAAARELCLLMGDRIDPADFAYTVRGDERAAEVARALVDAAPVFARR